MNISGNSTVSVEAAGSTQLKLKHPLAFKRKLAIYTGILALLLAIFTGMSLGIVNLTWQEVQDGLLGISQSDNYRVVHLIRMPRVICGALAGGFQGASWTHVSMILPYTMLGLAAAFFASRWLNALQFGEDTARSIGIRVERIRLLLLILAAMLAASAVSVAGMLGFVGLVVPHMVRLVTGSDFDYLLPCSALWGAAFVSLTDVAARMAFAPLEIPVGVFMSFLGAPFFLYLLKKGAKGI